MVATQGREGLVPPPPNEILQNIPCTIGRFLMIAFVGSQIVKAIIRKVDPVPYYSIQCSTSTFMFVNLFNNCKCRKNLQFVVNKYQQLKTVLWYLMSMYDRKNYMYM